MKKIIQLLLFFYVTATFSQSGNLDLTFNPSDTGFSNGFDSGNIVNKIILQPDGKTLAIGDFSSFQGIPRNKIARLNSDGSLDSSFNPIIDLNPTSFYDIISLQQDGKILIAGTFLSINGTATKHLTRLHQDGTLDNTFNIGTGFNQSVVSIGLQADGKILLGVVSPVVNNVSIRSMIRLNSNGTLDTSFNFENDAFNREIVTIVEQPNGKILISGRYLAGSSILNSVKRLNNDGTLDTTFITAVGSGDIISDMALLDDGKILIAGSFNFYNNVPVKRVARLNADGNVDTTFLNGITNVGFVYCIRVQTNGKILIGGNFTIFNGLPRNKIARLNEDGSIDNTFDSGAGIQGSSDNISSIAVRPNGKIIACGNFIVLNGINRKHFAQINENGTVDVSFMSATAAGNNVTAIKTQADGKILIGGFFDSYSDVSSRGIARLESNGVLDASFNIGSGTNGEVKAIAIQPDGKVLIAGKFTTINGISRIHVARLNVDGSLDNNFLPVISINGTGSLVNCIALQTDGKILLGGFFSVINSPNASIITRLNADGTLDTTFNVGFGSEGILNTILILNNGKILLGGGFIFLNSVQSNRLVLLNTNGTIDSSFNAGTALNSTVFTLALQSDGKILVGGNFTAYNNNTQKRLIRITDNGTLDASFVPQVQNSGIINAVAVASSGKIIIGGSFSNFNALPQRSFAQLNSDGTTDSNFQNPTGVVGMVNAIDIQPNGFVLIGGSFTSYNQVGRNRIARIQGGSNLGVTTNDVQKFQVSPNPTTGIFNIQTENLITNANITVADINGRIVYETKAENLDNKTLDLNNLQSGIYILNVSNGEHKYSQKIIKQ